MLAGTLISTWRKPPQINLANRVTFMDSYNQALGRLGLEQGMTEAGAWFLFFFFCLLFFSSSQNFLNWWLELRLLAAYGYIFKALSPEGKKSFSQLQFEKSLRHHSGWPVWGDGPTTWKRYWAEEKNHDRPACGNPRMGIFP